jgi:hypothetical protein
MSTMNSNIRIVANTVFPRDMVCVRNISVDTLHKGDTEDNNNNNNNNNNNKVSGREVKIKEFRYKDTTNVETEMYDYSSNNWSHWNGNEKLKEKFGRDTRKTFDTFTTKDSYTWNITYNTKSTAV